MAITNAQQARQLYRIGGVGGRAEEGSVERGGGRDPSAQFGFTPEEKAAVKASAQSELARRNELIGFGDKTGLSSLPSFLGIGLNLFKVKKGNEFAQGLIRNLTPRALEANRDSNDFIGDTPLWAQLGFNSEAEYLASLEDEEDKEDKEDEGLRLAFRANGGRIGFRGGAAAASDAAAGRDAGRDTSAAGTSDRGDGPATGGGPTGNVGGGYQKPPVVVNPLKNLSTHFANNQKLKDAVALGLITNEEYNTLGGYDVKQTMGMGPVDSFIGSLAYNTVQSLKGDQPFGDILGDSKRTAQGATNISPELQATYENIMKMADGGRAGLAEGGMPYEGGIMDLESARQMYGLGKLVKKVTRSVKKIAKSPIGKAALLYTGAAMAGSFGGTGSLFSKGMFNPGNIGRGIFGITAKGQALRGFPELAAKKGLLGKIGLTGGYGSIMPTAMGAIAGTSLLSGFLTKEQEEEAQLIADNTGIDIEEIRANPDKYLGRRFRAEGGSMDEPVAKKTMPLLDMGGKEMDLRAEGGFVPIGRMEKADDVPARLSKNEFVFTADAVRNAGDGNVDKGAEVMYNMMKNLESGGDVSEESQGLEGARKMFQTSQRLEEVL